MADEMTAAEKKRLKAQYNWILGIALEDPTQSLPRFWKQLQKVIASSQGDTAVIEAFVAKQLPKIDAFRGLYEQQARSAIVDAQPALAAEVDRAVELNRQTVQAIAEKYGISVTPERMDELARAARTNGWGTAELLLNMRPDLDRTLQAGDTTGLAGDAQNDLQEWAAKNGLPLSSEASARYVANMTLGSQSLDDVKAELRRTYLAGAYPAWADKINAGYDPTDIFSPYLEYAKQLLEDDNITLSDPIMQKITQAVTADGKPMAMPLYQAQQMIRKDDRWQRTNNAYGMYANVANDVLRTFGFQ